ncbi:hypothetical protein [Deinococcus aerophilus]|uniref:Protective antigen Ca-binding domain-containing protein n=1 Tax=Deinococcus aerophilus TaxID=522488 RepID=A0ABQ2H0B4_9DEIO|nr:hypothetical protein [Deinococcus aerophilus]GGM20697.1 hypothetical protein GCM10010841_30880 [Deinococcus aerophilus]
MTRGSSLITLLLSASLLIGCGQESPAVTAPPVNTSKVALTAAVATNNASVLLTFSAEPDAAALNPAQYHLKRPDGSELSLQGVFPIPGTRQAVLATSTQPTGQLTLLRGGAAPVTLASSNVEPPALTEVTPLNSTQVLLRFAGSRGDAAALAAVSEQPGLYRIGDLNVTAAKLSADKSAVLLTTSQQHNTAYRLEAAGMMTRDLGLIQPGGVTFTGMGTPDVVPPRAVDVSVSDRMTVVVRFSEPVTAPQPGNFVIRSETGVLLGVKQATFTDEFRTAVRLTTDLQQPGIYRVQVQGLTDASDNALEAAGPLTFAGTGTADQTPPTVQSLQATSPTQVVVTFSEPVRGGAGEDGAENPAHYTIQGSVLGAASMQPAGAASVLKVTAATLSSDQRSVTLTTLEQAPIQYELSAANIRDLSGNVIDTTTGNNRRKPVFRGISPSGTGQDSDGDGLPDSVEQAGWTISVRLANGQVVQREVTSDPFNPDTDGDCARKAELQGICLNDRDEMALGLDPRSLDTDGDTLGDNEESNLFLSDAADQDSDGDGLNDALEVNMYRTSPILDDTDGDQFKDGDEATSGKRNPLISDLPQVQIDTGAISLTLDERYSYTDSTGKATQVDSSTSATLEQGSNNTYASSRSSSLATMISHSISMGVSASISADPGVEVTAEYGHVNENTAETSATTSAESSASANRAYNQSVARSQSFDSRSDVTRTLDGASMRVAVSIANASDLAYTIKDLELSALQQDPADRTRLIPVATPTSENPGAVYNLGPLVSKRGPFLFANTTLYPKTVEDLMRAPHGLIFRAANYNLTDEAGRNYAFSSRDSYDRTAEITIDYGDGRTLTRRVATASTFDPVTGAPQGISMKYALRTLLKLNYQTGAAPNQAGSVLTGLGGVNNDLSRHKLWALITTLPSQPDVDFDDRMIHAGDTVILTYQADQDQDGLLAAEESLYGSKDTESDTDADGLSDPEEVRTGWRIHVVGQTPYTAFSDPRTADSDNDGLTDIEEKRLGTDPRKRDTDGDWLTDAEEINGFTMRYKAGKDDPGPPTVVRSNALDPDSDGDGLTDGLERRLGSNPNLADASKFVDTDEDGVSDHDETNGFASTVNGQSRTFTSYNDAADSDGDHLPDLLEHLIKTNPQSNNTDGDGLTDDQEFDPATFSGFNAFVQACAQAKNCTYTQPSPGNAVPYGTSPLLSDTDGDTLDDRTEVTGSWTVEITGATGDKSSRTVTSSPIQKDSDGDGWDDHVEFQRKTDPRMKDTDSDGTNDPEDAARCVTPGSCTSPLVMDQVVTVEMVSIRALRDGDGEGDEDDTDPGEFSFTMRASVPGENGDNGTPVASSGKSNVAIKDGQTLPIGKSVSFV